MQTQFPLLSPFFIKIWVALTGFFLCIFLIIHLIGNSLLLLPPPTDTRLFNLYAATLSGNPFIKLVSYFLYLSIILHIALTAFITLKNRALKVKKYEKSPQSRWSSRNMGILGSVILIFLIIHFKDFWYVYKFGDLGVDKWNSKDLYSVVRHAFESHWYVLFYCLAMLGLGFHLQHGSKAMVRTLGLTSKPMLNFIDKVSLVYTVVITTGFFIIPIVMYFSN